MERWKAIGKKLLYPGRGWVALLTVLGGVSLVLTFLVFGDRSPFAYVSYLLSAYGLTVLVAAAAARLVPAVRRWLHHIPLAHRYLTDPYFKVRSGLALSLFVNLFYGGFKLTAAIMYTSFWEGALAVYYVLLCVARAYLIRNVPVDAANRDGPRELRQYRCVGVFLLLLDLALSVIATQIVLDDQGSDYPGVLIYVAAMYAFYSLTLAIVNKARYRRLNSPVLSAAKAVNLTCALVSMFNLETAMLAQFGADQPYFRLVMTSATAFCVCAAVLGLAVFMVIVSARKLRGLKRN